MVTTIPRSKATGPMRQTWDRLMAADAALENYKRTKEGDRDAILREHGAAINAYWKACRAAGYIGRSNRTKPPHLTP